MVSDAVTLQDVADTLQTLGAGSLPAYMANINGERARRGLLRDPRIAGGAQAGRSRRFFGVGHGALLGAQADRLQGARRPTRFAKVTNELLAAHWTFART